MLLQLNRVALHSSSQLWTFQQKLRTKRSYSRRAKRHARLIEDGSSVNYLRRMTPF